MKVAKEVVIVKSEILARSQPRRIGLLGMS